MRQIDLKYLNQRIPRYTSYPTAVQFGPDVDARSYTNWLTAMPEETVSIYIHVPFCAELCLYCGCHTTVARRYTPVAAYVELLEREFDLVGRIIGPHVVSALHWGGGTPTMLTPQDFGRVMATIRKNFVFAPQAELAIEIDPRTLTHGNVAALAEAGMTRASLGVQDFNPIVQRAVRREQNFEQTARAADWLRGAGIANINLDLMYGLPHQTVDSVGKTVERALAVEPDRIALFGYAHVPWMKRHQRLLPEPALPDTGERFAQSRMAAGILTGSGYLPIGLDHFAKPGDLLAVCQREGRLRRNFQGYTTDQSSVLLGFGTSAISTLPQGYVQNAAAMPVYRDALRAGRAAVVRGRALTNDDRLRREIIERLMCDLHADLDRICAAHNKCRDDLADELARLDDLARDDLVERVGGTISIPESKRSFIRTVCASFDAYLTDNAIRYSRAS
jgi:oxygen-independent coproporphyrinogen III oxidase